MTNLQWLLILLSVWWLIYTAEKSLGSDLMRLLFLLVMSIETFRVVMR